MTGVVRRRAGIVPLLVLALIAVLGACSDDEPDAPDSPANSQTASTVGPGGAGALTASSVLRPDGVGPVWVGTPLSLVGQISSVPFRQEDRGTCLAITSEDPAGLTFTSSAAGGGRMELVSVVGGQWATAAGVRIGTPLEQLVAAYPTNELHMRLATVNDVPQPTRALYLPADPRSVRFAIAFESDGASVTGIVVGVRELVEAPDPCA